MINRGFTLIEILIVLLIISIVSAAVLFTIHPNQNRQIETFTKDFVEVMQFAEEEARLKTQTLRVVFRRQAFIFQRYHPNEDKEHPWVNLQDSILGSHPIPEFIQVTVKQKGDEGENQEQQIVISSNGDLTPFTMYVGKRKEKPLYMILGEADGELSSKALR